MYLQSNCVELGSVNLENVKGQISMLPFDMLSLAGLPKDKHLFNLVSNMVVRLPIIRGEAYLTVDSRKIQKGTTHRRGGPHIDGNYLKELCGWSDGQGGGNGWKVGGDGRTLTKEQHISSYNVKRGGMLIVSDYPACKGWNLGKVPGKAGIGGDCSHMDLGEGFILSPDKLYYTTSQFIHESIPVDRDVDRTLVRVTLPEEYPYLFIN